MERNVNSNYSGMSLVNCRTVNVIIYLDGRGVFCKYLQDHPQVRAYLTETGHISHEQLQLLQQGNEITFQLAQHKAGVIPTIWSPETQVKNVKSWWRKLLPF